MYYRYGDCLRYFQITSWTLFKMLYPQFPLSGDEGIRTPDLRRAKAALSQLSYIPGTFQGQWAFQDSNLRPRPYQRRALTN